MIIKEDNIYNVCKILSSYIKKLRPDIKINEYINEEFQSCSIDIADKKISEGSSKIGLGEFDAFMSISYSGRHKEINTEIPIILAIDKRKKDDTISIPDNCKISTIHSHSGKHPVIHLHMNCKDGKNLSEVARLVDTISKINEKNTRL